MTEPVRIGRPLTDPERSLLMYLAVRSVADQTACTQDAAADALDELAGRGLVHFRGDGRDVYVTVDGHVIVHAARDWLAFMALAADDGDAPPAVGEPIQ